MNIFKTPVTDDGFTLLEVMVSIAVLLVGLLGAAAMQISSIQWNSRSSHLTEATTVGLNQVEEILSWNFNDTRLADTDTVNFQKAGGVNDTADNSIANGKYTVYWDGESNNDPVNGQQVGIDLAIDVVWMEGDRLKTIPFNITKPR